MAACGVWKCGPVYADARTGDDARGAEADDGVAVGLAGATGAATGWLVPLAADRGVAATATCAE